jgi:hypothetical protein
VWADPDLDDAASALQQIHANPAEAALRGEQASADILSRYSPPAVATIVAGRVDWIGERLTTLHISGRFVE